MKKAVSLLLVFVMLIGMLPAAAFSAEETAVLTETGSDAAEENLWKDRSAVFVGDSITAGDNASKYYRLLEQSLELGDVTVMGVGGSCISAYSDYGTGNQPLINRYQSIPSTDLIMVFMGTNDYGHETPLGSVEDTQDGTFYGALNTIIPALVAKHTASKLVFVTPLHRYGFGTSKILGTNFTYDHIPNGVGATLGDYVDALKTVCASNGVSVIDLHTEYPLDPSDANVRAEYMPDGIHPNAAGHEVIAGIMETHIRTFEPVQSEPIVLPEMIQGNKFASSSNQSCRASSRINYYLEAGTVITLKDPAAMQWACAKTSNEFSNNNLGYFPDSQWTDKVTALVAEDGWIGFTFKYRDETRSFDLTKPLSDYITIEPPHTHAYENGICTVCGAAHPNLANYEGKVISVLGDSISTFAGYIPTADGFNLEHLPRYPQDNLLTDVNETWWMQVVAGLDGKLGINDSWRGATVSGAKPVTTGTTGENAAMPNLTRIQNLGANGTPDVILFYGGTNDLAHVSNVGSFDPDTAPTAVDLTTKKWDNLADGYVHTLLRLRHYYPDATVVAMLPTYTASYYSADKLAQANTVLAQICDHYDVTYVDLRYCGISTGDLPDGIHPDANGMDYISAAVMKVLLDECEMSAGENVVYSVTHRLTGAESSLSYYKGVTQGKSFVTTITGEDVVASVTMGGVDITDTVYAGGVVTIGEVTGDVVITAEGRVKAIYEDHLQQLPQDLCSKTNLWAALEHDKQYYTASGWGTHGSGTVYSVTFPVSAGDRICATSFGAAGSNGSSINGIRVTWFDENGLLATVGTDKVYAEFAANGYLSVPEGATIVSIPMWTVSDANEIYLLNRGHTYENGVCIGCADWNICWEVGTIAAANGANNANATRIRTLDYLRLSDFAGVCVNSGYQLTWLAYDADKNYIGNGTSSFTGYWQPSGHSIATADIQDLYADAVYFRLALKSVSGGNMTLEDVQNSGVTFVPFGQVVPEPEYELEYESSLNIGAWQDGAIWNGKLFLLGAAGTGAVYDLENRSKLATFSLDSVDVLKPHANSVCFSRTYYASGDKYPLLYVNIYNNYASAEDRMEGTCCVYRISETDNSFATELVQVIRIGFVEDLSLWKSKENNGDVRPYGNFLVDTDDNKLYAYVMRDAANATRFFKFDLPKLTDGVYSEAYGCNVVTLESTDIEGQFDTEYFSYLQGGTYSSGMILSAEGFSSGGSAEPAIRIVDLQTGTVRATYYMANSGLATEPEVVCIDPATGLLYYAPADGILRVLRIPDVHFHGYTSVVTEPTCTEQGYTTYTCICGDSYVADFVDATGHTYENGICTACGVAQWDTDGDGALEILAIGNSFSVDALQYAYQIAQNLGIEKIVIGNLYIGGCTLATHAANAAGDLGKYTYYFNDNGTWTSTGSYKISTALESRSWDYVSMQQGSPVSGVESSYNEDLTDLIAYVQARSDAKLVWHMTWAYQQDSTHSAFPTYNKDQMTMYNAIVSAVRSKIVTNGDFDLIVPNGTAVQNSRTSLLGDTTTRDGYHMSYDYGRYLTGLLFIKTVTGLSIDDITYAPSGVDAEEKAIAIESTNNASVKPFEVTQSAYIKVEPEIPEEGYILLKPELHKGAYWHSINADHFNTLVTDASNSKYFFATIRFTRETLPVGSIIVLEDGWQYRPEGWITDAVQTSRADTTKESYVVVTEEWWGDYTIRGFNISKVGTPSLMNLNAEDVHKAFRIYVPEEKHSHDYTSVVTAPTCTEQGYTTYTCTLCGESHVDDYVDATGHTYENGTCAGCGEVCAAGDANGDGCVNTQDTLLIMKYLAGWGVEIVLTAADANGDGCVNTQDTLLIMKYLAGYDVTLGIQE